jgi:predicted RNA methylase
VKESSTTEMSFIDLQAKIAHPGWTPGRRDIGAVLSQWRNLTDSERASLEKRLSRVDAPCAQRAAVIFSGLDDRTRGDLCRPLLKAFLTAFDVVSDPETFPLDCLRDETPRVRKAAAQALGASWSAVPAKFRGVFVETMIALLRSAADPSEIKALIESLGKSGSPDALKALEARAAGRSVPDVSKASLTAAVLTARRDVTRSETRDDVAGAACNPELLSGHGILLYLTPGIEQIARMRPPFLKSEVLDQGLLFAEGMSWNDIAPHSLWREAGVVLGEWDQASAVTLAQLIYAQHQEIVAATTVGHGPVRLRLGRDDGRGRSFVWEFAAALDRLGPEIMNDGRAAHWELRTWGSMVVIVPLMWTDLRYPWRDMTIDGASDPTIASALVQLANIKPGETVYDPFCGAGTELILAAKAEPSAVMVGSEINAAIADAARDAVHRAQVTVSIHVADALKFNGGPFDVIMTNPPFGMRTVRGGARELLADFFVCARKLLSKNGRVVMLSHAPRSTKEWAAAGQLRLTRSFPLRLGGMGCEIQVFGPI